VTGYANQNVVQSLRKTSQTQLRFHKLLSFIACVLEKINIFIPLGNSSKVAQLFSMISKTAPYCPKVTSGYNLII